MANHPNRSRHAGRANPTSGQIRTKRLEAGLSVAEAARFVYTNRKTWHRWESQTDSSSMHPGLWELFKLKVDVMLRRPVDIVLPKTPYLTRGACDRLLRVMPQ